MSLFMVHATLPGVEPSLAGEGAPDVVGVRFTEEEAMAMAKGCRARRMATYALATGAVYVTEGGRRMVWKEEA